MLNGPLKGYEIQIALDAYLKKKVIPKARAIVIPNTKCPRGGEHEWVRDEDGWYCEKCLEPRSPRRAKGL